MLQILQGNDFFRNSQLDNFSHCRQVHVETKIDVSLLQQRNNRREREHLTSITMQLFVKSGELMGSVFKNVRMYDLVYLFCYYVKEVNPSSHVGTCLNILMNACRVKGMHHTLCIYMRHTEEAVTVCTTWEQHHTAHEAM